jgi:prepilin-type N-terminal cleavage/methylation domain-containing protein
MQKTKKKILKMLKMKNQKEKSFTLLELLVVIAVIAILAAIVLVSLSSARQNAWEARGLQFSQNIKSTLATDLVGEWTFDDSTNPGRDDSGNGNNCFKKPDDTTGPNSTQGKVRGALEFNGSSQYLDCGDSGSLDVDKEISIEAWIYPKSPNLTYYRAIVAKYSQSDNKRAYQLIVDEGYSTYLGQGTVQLWISPDGQNRDHVEALAFSNKWQHIVGTYNGSMMSIYVNGELKDKKNTTFDGIFITDKPLRIGSDQILSRFFLGTIDEVRIYNRALTAYEIKALYAEGKMRHLAGR